MKKFVAGLIAGVSVLALTLIAVLLETTTFLKPRWKIVSASLGLCAIMSMFLQGLWAKRDEDDAKEGKKEEFNERNRLYVLIERVCRRLAALQPHPEHAEMPFNTVWTTIRNLEHTPAEEASDVANYLQSKPSREEAIERVERFMLQMLDEFED